MIHLKIAGYIAGFVLAFIALFIVAPALISAKSTVAVVGGLAIIGGAIYAVGFLLHRAYKSIVNSNKEIS